MSEFDELVSRKGVLVAGRFGPDWRVAEQKSAWLVIEEPQAIAMISSFCASIQMLLNTMALAMSDVTAVSWQPLKGWGVSSGVYSLRCMAIDSSLAKPRSSGASTNCSTCCGKEHRKHWGLLDVRGAFARACRSDHAWPSSVALTLAGTPPAGRRGPRSERGARGRATDLHERFEPPRVHVPDRRASCATRTRTRDASGRGWSSTDWAVPDELGWPWPPVAGG